MEQNNETTEQVQEEFVIDPAEIGGASDEEITNEAASQNQDDDLAEKAAMLGVDEATLASYGSNAAATLDGIEQALYHHGTKAGDTFDGPITQQRGDILEEFKDTLDEDALKALGRIREHYDSQLQHLNGALSQLQEQRMVEELDRYFEELPPEMGAVFGRGGKLTQEQIQARVAVVSHGNTFMRGFLSTGTQMPPIKQIMDMGRRRYNGNKAAKPATSAATSRTSSARPAAKPASKSANTDRQAISFIHNFLKEKGAYSDEAAPVIEIAD